MSVKNLHSILGGKWFIHEEYGKSLLPSLIVLMQGNGTVETPPTEEETPVSTVMRNGAAQTGTPKGPDQYAVILNLKDPIYKYSQDCGPQGTKSKMRVLENYKNDPSCIGVVLDIDSGGGQVSGTPEFHDYILNFGKPIVSYTDGLMCSAAYYIGSAASYIVANKRADAIGSIGTMIHFIDFTGYYEKQGAKVITEYATKSTEKNRDFEELLQGNPEGYIKNELDPITDTFHADMNAARPKLNAETLKGGTWDANGALKMGLIDEVGTLQTAIDKVFELANANSNNNNNMSKQRDRVQAVLGLNAPLAETAEKGSYLNAEQLDALESGIEADAATIADLTGKVTAAEAAKTTAETALADANTAHTTATNAVSAEVTAMVEAAGLTPAATTAENLANLKTKYAAYNAADGAKPTKTDVDTKGNTPKGGAEVFGIDMNGLNNS